MGLAYSSDEDSYYGYSHRRYHYGGNNSSDDDIYWDRGGGSHGRRAEKSAAAIRREDEAKRTFDDIQTWVDAAYARARHRVVRLGTRADSGSPLNTLPEDVMETILEYAGDPTTLDLTKSIVPASVVARSLKTAAAAASSSSQRGHHHNNAKKSASSKAAGKQRATKASPPPATMKCGIDRLCHIYEPGKEHWIDMLDPKCHLTGPCWRDVGRHVRSKAGWGVKRIKATPQQKALHKETRQGAVYFVKAIFTVPGTKKKKPSQKKRKKPTKTTAGAATTARKKPATAAAKAKAPLMSSSAANVTIPSASTAGAKKSSSSAPPTSSYRQAAMVALQSKPPAAVPRCDPTNPEMERRMAKARAAAGYALPVAASAAGGNKRTPSAPKARASSRRKK